MAMLAMAFPIPAGKTDRWKKFISELTGARKADFAASRRTLGVRERTFLQRASARSHAGASDWFSLPTTNTPSGIFAAIRGDRQEPGWNWSVSDLSGILGGVSNGSVWRLDHDVFHDAFHDSQFDGHLVRCRDQINRRRKSGDRIEHPRSATLKMNPLHGSRFLLCGDPVSKES
jgi:hypothetical protein